MADTSAFYCRNPQWPIKLAFRICMNFLFSGILILDIVSCIHVRVNDFIIVIIDSIMQEEQCPWQIMDKIQMDHSFSSAMANNLTLI